MADAQEFVAPLKKEAAIEPKRSPSNPKGEKERAALNQEWDTEKKYVFHLAARNMEREKPVINMRTGRPVPHSEFEYKPFQNLLMTSQIVWDKGRVGIRYYDGCESIFISEQPKEKDVIDELIKQTRPRNFLKGKLVIEGYEKMLLLYVSMCSTNTESDFRVSNAYGVFYPVNKDKKATAESARMDKIEQALELAKKASEDKMRIHANYLGIETVDFDSGNELSPTEIRAAYRKAALNDADGFITSYGNKSIEIKYYIDKALMDGNINNKLNPNKAAWGNSDNPICDISGLRSNEAIAAKLYEFANTEEGEEFVIQLKAIYNT